MLLSTIQIATQVAQEAGPGERFLAFFLPFVLIALALGLASQLFGGGGSGPTK